jgi:hypothetical protein
MTALARRVLVVAGLYLAAQAGLVVFGPMTVNEEIECGSLFRPERSATLTGQDEALCRSALADQRVWAVSYTALAALSLVGFCLVPRRTS